MSSIVAPTAALAPRAAVRASRSRVASSRSVAFSPANVRATRPRQVSLAAKPKEKDVDWDAKTKEMTAERIMESCLEAMADGDENQLEACLLELEDESERADVIDNLQKTPQVKGDKFWQEKLKEIAAERVLDNCMAAVVRPFHPSSAISHRHHPARVPEPTPYLFRYPRDRYFGGWRQSATDPFR